MNKIIPTDLPNVRGKYRTDVQMAKISWFRLGGTIDVLYIPKDLDDLQFFLKECDKDITVTPLGVCSNVVPSDGMIHRVVIKLGRAFNYVNIDEECSGNNRVTLKVGASSLDTNVAAFAMMNGITGLEFLSGIPGTIGGAIKMNAGAYDKDFASICDSVYAISRIGEIASFTKEEMKFHYRGNALSDEWIFLGAKINGEYGDKKHIAEKMHYIKEQRNLTQPIQSPTSGSTFKNPPHGKKAWELIDEAGCRGLKVGGAVVSDLHCNFIINDGGATGQDMRTLIRKIQAAVLAKSAVELETEVIFI